MKIITFKQKDSINVEYLNEDSVIVYREDENTYYLIVKAYYLDKYYTIWYNNGNFNILDQLTFSFEELKEHLSRKEKAYLFESFDKAVNFIVANCQISS